jgi:drug/metabolite transporter (DMT)-like permease
LTSLLHAGLEPVYGILFALILLSEIPTLQTLVGGVMIVGVSILMSIKHGTN